MPSCRAQWSVVWAPWTVFLKKKVVRGTIRSCSIELVFLASSDLMAPADADTRQLSTRTDWDRDLGSETILTRVEGVAGDPGALQPLGQLVGEKHVAQFAVGVGLEDPREGGPQPQGLVPGQALEIDLSEVVGQRGHVDDPAGAALLQPVQQQVGQQEVAHVVDAKHHPQPVLRAALHVHPWDTNGRSRDP